MLSSADFNFKKFASADEKQQFIKEASATLNELWDKGDFLKILKSGTMQDKEAALSTTYQYILTTVYDESILDRVIPPVEVSDDDLQRDEKYDQRYYLLDVDDFPRKGNAYIVNVWDKTGVRIPFARRIKIPFTKARIPEYRKDEEELKAYKMPFTDLLKREISDSVRRVYDSQFIDTLNAIITANPTYAISAAGTRISKTDIVTMMQALDQVYIDPTGQDYAKNGGESIPPGAWLAHKSRWRDIQTWSMDDIGNMVDKLFFEGFNYDVLQGVRVVKVYDYVDKDHVWLIPPPKAFGFNGNYNGGFHMEIKVENMTEIVMNGYIYKMVAVANDIGLRRLDF